ncbi:MAG: DUF1553 domain-containing protein [Planctomyces sp.]
MNCPFDSLIQPVRQAAYRTVFVRLLSAVLLTSAVSVNAADTNQRPIAFDRDIRPILSDHCFACHGPDEKQRKASLRLDVRESAFAVLESGGAAVVEGKPEDSLLVQRIHSADADVVMPPPSFNKALTADQKELLNRWIREGATWTDHWAFQSVKMPEMPVIGKEAVEQNPIDGFVAERLAEDGLQFSPEEDRARLIRRVALDLTGLPPTVEDVDAFLNDTSEKAFETVVDRVLSNPHYGERMALVWLDLARYGDTSGYHNDSLRDMWLWREWVINAFNQNMRFDQFTTEQLAGDLLPNASTSQQIASGFHRNVMTSDEGGLIDAEYRNLYVVDRVNTTGVTWLGMTIGCAQCHDHKYDPVTQRDYYQLYAFFNNVPETGKDGVRDRNPKPFLRVTTPEQDAELKRMTEEFETAQASFKKQSEGLTDQQIEQNAELAALKKSVPELQKNRDEYEKSLPNTMVMAEMETPRDTFIKVRGNYDQDGEKVLPAAPSFLPAMADAGGERKLNRLDLARWLTSENHPLTARVTVNRFWAMLFGTGLVKTLNDFGSQGERPSHPELLDWLAADFQKDWDIKRVVKQIVMSRTYRQTARASSDLLLRDSANRLLARGPRQRLDAELIRDNALAIAGILNPVQGGRSIKPAQPEGTWEINEMSGYKYEKSTGADLYRRGLYVYWRRSTVYPSFVTLDAPTREFCVAQRAKTSTPLQSLVLMNDPVFVEAARAFAQRILTETHADDRSRIIRAWRLCLARTPSDMELTVLERTLSQMHSTYSGDAESAAKLVAVGDLPRPEGVSIPDLAAWTAFSNVLLNLNETITN